MEMDAIADALVYAVTYVDRHGADQAESLFEGDVGALDRIAASLRNATPVEEDALAAAAERAGTAERAAPTPRPAFVRNYERWMEAMFGEGWQGNRRVPVGE
jgi:hypothetical protein